MHHKTRQTALHLALLLLAVTTAKAQFDIEDSHTTANLRGVHNVGGGVVWASGENGTVRRSEDEGYLWQLCTIPPGAEKLDFRGIQAFDANTAIVMSSGKGDLSRLYKTTDGCQTWKLLFTNPDKEGFWDAILAPDPKAPPMIIGDPVDRHFEMFVADNNLANNWQRLEHIGRAPDLKIPMPHSQDERLFAASNSILQGYAYNGFSFVTGGKSGSFFYTTKWHVHALFDYSTATFLVKRLPLATGESAGAFSFAADYDCSLNPVCKLVAVGGDYQKPNEANGTGTFSVDAGLHWSPSQTQPHGYRSSVAYEPTTKTWITVGPNGTDISTDDGRNWRALKPNLKDSEAPDADKNWNALSLPFVVGPHGRIGKLRTNDLTSNRKGVQ